MFNNIFLVGLGGCLGSIARYLMAMGVNRYFMASLLPLGTLTVNVLGCFVIGFLGGLAINKQYLAEHSRLFLFTGVLGGFTTFSAFSLETFYLMRTTHWWMAFLNVLLHVVIGLSATAFGYWLSKTF